MQGLHIDALFKPQRAEAVAFMRRNCSPIDAADRSVPVEGKFVELHDCSLQPILNNIKLKRERMASPLGLQGTKTKRHNGACASRRLKGGAISPSIWADNAAGR